MKREDAEKLKWTIILTIIGAALFIAKLVYDIWPIGYMSI